MSELTAGSVVDVVSEGARVQLMLGPRRGEHPVRLTVVALEGGEPGLRALRADPCWRLVERAPSVFDMELPLQGVGELLSTDGLVRRLLPSGRLYGLVVPTPTTTATIVAKPNSKLTPQQQAQLGSLGLRMDERGFVRGAVRATRLAELLLHEWLGAVRVEGIDPPPLPRPELFDEETDPTADPIDDGDTL